MCECESMRGAELEVDELVFRAERLGVGGWDRASSFSRDSVRGSAVG